MMRRTFAVASILSTFALACTAQKEPPPATSGKAVLEAYVSAWNQHDTTALDTLMTPDAIHEDLAQGFRGGPAETKGFMRQNIAAGPDFQWRLTDVFESGSRVGAEWTWTATYTGPSPVGDVVGRPISGRGASIAEIENGKIKHLTDFYDIASYFAPATTDSAKK